MKFGKGLKRKGRVGDGAVVLAAVIRHHLHIIR